MQINQEFFLSKMNPYVKAGGNFLGHEEVKDFEAWANRIGNFGLGCLGFSSMFSNTQHSWVPYTLATGVCSLYLAKHILFSMKEAIDEAEQHVASQREELHRLRETAEAVDQQRNSLQKTNSHLNEQRNQAIREAVTTYIELRNERRQFAALGSCRAQANYFNT